ncbi:MAG: hypothetical protein E6Q76_07345 [Rhizobium sp.]|nr:MAG: hypothetical protein E6Q76_07345 [Rhizobium sp.]
MKQRKSISVTEFIQVAACEGKVFGPEKREFNAPPVDLGKSAESGIAEHKNHDRNVREYMPIDRPEPAGNWLTRILRFILRLLTGGK